MLVNEAVNYDIALQIDAVVREIHREIWLCQTLAGAERLEIYAVVLRFSATR